MSPFSASDEANANEQFDTAPRPSRRSNGESSHENPDLRQFAAVIAQLKHDNIASLASSIRQVHETVDIESPSSSVIDSRTSCTVLPEPLYGSYNLAYRILFEDGVQWILKIPVNGHHACFDRLAAETLTSEALTMNMIKQNTSIPIPTVHDFDPSADNEIGCPYIMMDFLKGKPAWQGWFDEKASKSSLEQFRARCLQTVAAAMVQLSQFAVDRSGSLRFDSDGRPVGIAGARVPDWLAEEEIMQGLKTADEGCLYCEKGPFALPGYSFLYMLNRRGSRDKDSLYTRGIHETVRLLTHWTLEKDRSSNGIMREFVLAHPDFALQNFLVEDDGTLCGVIDWDGVAAVPISIGCLRYPDWLMSDWHPWYDYHPGVAGQRENSPEELATYRNMYAQFVEAFSSITCESTKVGKLHADITRRSLVAGTINLGAHDLKLTDEVVGNIFEKLEVLTADYEDVDASDENLELTSGTGSDDVEEENSSGKNESTETNDGSPGDGKEDNFKCLCSKCIAELAPNQPSPKNLDESRSGQKFLTDHSTCFDGPGLGTENSLTDHSSGIHNQEIARDQSEYASRKANFANWAFALGEQGSKAIVTALHKEEGGANTSPRKVRMVKWALDMGGKCCKEASKVFHKQEGASGPHSKDQSQATPVQNDSHPVSKTVKTAITLCTRTEALLRKLIISLHQDNLSSNEGPRFQKTEVGRVRAFFEWLVDLLKKVTRNQIEDDRDDSQTPTPTEGQMSARYVLVNSEHCQRCNPGAGSQGHENSNDDMQSSQACAEDIWASIAAEVEEGGIPIDMIQKHRNVIAQSIIQNLGKEMEREKELKNEKAAKKAKKAQKQAAMKGMNDASNLDPATLADLESNNAEFDLGEAGKAERDATQSGISEVSAAKISDEETGMAPHFVEDPTEGANRKQRMTLSSIAKPEDNGNPSTTNVIGAAPEDNKVPTEQPRYAKVGNPDNNHTSLEAIEPTDHQLRVMLANTQGLEPVNSNLQQEILRVAETANGVSESENHSQISSFTPPSGACPKSVAARSKTIFKGGRWFETPRGSLRRVEEASLHGNLYNEEGISTYGNSISDLNGSSSGASAAGHGDKNAAEISHLQPASTNHEEFNAVNTFKVPDINEDDQGIEVGESTNDENGGEFEDGEIHEEPAPSSLEIRLNREGSGPLSDDTSEAEVKNKPKAGEIVDNGYFTIGEVCVALAKGNLDEWRMTRLKEGFLALLDDTVGMHNRR